MKKKTPTAQYEKKRAASLLNQLDSKKITQELIEATKDPKVNQFIKVTRSPFSNMDSLLGFRTKGVDEGTLNWVGENLDEWSKIDTSIVFFDFLDIYGIPESTYYQWLEKDERLREVHSHCMQRIGSRRFKLSIFKNAECNEKALSATIRVYSTEHRKCYDEDISKKRTHDIDGERVMVVVKDFNQSNE